MAGGDLWFFDRIAPLYDLAMPSADPDALGAALALADGEVERVLDVGGGTGRAARAIDAPHRVVVDASAGMLGRVPPGIAAVRGSATDLPVRDGAADAALIVDALHHLPDQRRAVGEAARSLRSGGVLVVREFDRTTLRGRALELGEAAIGMDSTFLSAAALADLLSAAGLDATITERGFACTVAGVKP